MSDFAIRNETRRQRYNKKLANAQTIPVSLCAVNFEKNSNIGFCVRAAACFGAFEVCLIGNRPNRDIMNDVSGSTFDYVNFKEFPNSESFIEYCRKNDIELVTFELPDENFPSIALSDYEFNFNKKTCIIVGHETTGVPVELLAASKRVHIPMRSIGFCLNTACVANIAMYEASTRYNNLKCMAQ